MFYLLHNSVDCTDGSEQVIASHAATAKDCAYACCHSNVVLGHYPCTVITWVKTGGACYMEQTSQPYKCNSPSSSGAYNVYAVRRSNCNAIRSGAVGQQAGAAPAANGAGYEISLSTP